MGAGNVPKGEVDDDEEDDRPLDAASLLAGWLASWLLNPFASEAYT